MAFISLPNGLSLNKCAIKLHHRYNNINEYRMMT
jgi:hypothetical protein